MADRRFTYSDTRRSVYSPRTYSSSRATSSSYSSIQRSASDHYTPFGSTSYRDHVPLHPTIETSRLDRSTSGLNKVIFYHYLKKSNTVKHILHLSKIVILFNQLQFN